MSASTSGTGTSPAQAIRAAISTLGQFEWRMKQQVSNPLAGEYRSVFRGKGMEFDQVVRYTYGDDVRDIDWKVTARMREPYRKKFVEERELTILIVFEDRLSLQFGSAGRSKRDALLELICQVMMLAAENRDRIGIIHARPGGYRLTKPVRGRDAIMHAAAKLLAEPPPELNDTRPVRVPWRFVGQAAPRHSVLVWGGDFAPQAEPLGWTMMKGRYRVLGFRVDDPWERELPTDQPLTIYDPMAQHLVVLDPRAKDQRAAHAEWVAKREERFAALFRDPRERLVVLADGSMPEALARFFQGHMAAH
ncbi:DUF58 domain-containing protein [Actomonas aquatica]|uniref:DUF58 domain-containing protein n=1 Tax=Actomonas aquatica TaxID=2866162 RepID=A0ABZ1CEM7_9BACT|nr:DUF58 domain-containing protein [Opitutus sp. WL0086]WRQ89064.1 DUF58 domain-containing protein [Opitutus sp. WL0086]